MQYKEIVKVYEDISKTSKRLEKVDILSAFFIRLGKEGKSEWIYLLQGKVTPGYDVREFGMSRQLIIKALSASYGVSIESVVQMFNKIGDLGKIAAALAEKRRQSVLFSKKLTMESVFSNLQRILSVNGKGAVERKIQCLSEILASAEPVESQYIIRTVLQDLRIGVAEGIIRDALTLAFFREERESMGEKIQSAYDLSNDFAVVFDAAIKGKQALDEIRVIPGKPLNVMLAIKAASIAEAFSVCGIPAAVEYKYDGFRMLIHKKAGKIQLFTRKLEEVSKQFPDVVDAVKENIIGESFILDAEAVGYNPKNKKYLPFEAVSQRIKRKYDIDKLREKLPVEVNVFDVLYYDGNNYMNSPLSERRKILEKLVKNKKWVIKTSEFMIVHKENEAETFYAEALKEGQEGIMVKNLSASYQQGRKVGFMVKVKPVVNDIDLVIVGAEHGSGKRAGWLTSYIIACRSGEGEMLEIGKVSSGLKEKEEEGTSYEQMSELLKPLIISKEGSMVKVKPQIVVSVTYQNIQPSPSYSSGYALRFPRISAYRPDRTISDIATIEDIEREVRRCGKLYK